MIVGEVESAHFMCRLLGIFLCLVIKVRLSFFFSMTLMVVKLISLRSMIYWVKLMLRQ